MSYPDGVLHRARVAIVDDDDDLREAVASILAPRWRVEPYTSAREALAAARAGELAKIVLFDLHLPGESAPPTITKIVRAMPEVAVVVLTSHQRDEWIFEALRAGALGYLVKERDLTALADMLEIVQRGGSPLSPGVARRVLESLHEAPPTTGLSDRELEVIRLFADGMGYDEAARALDIAVDTLRTHVRRAYKKLGVTNRAEAVARLFRRRSR